MQVHLSLCAIFIFHASSLVTMCYIYISCKFTCHYVLYLYFMQVHLSLWVIFIFHASSLVTMGYIYISCKFTCHYGLYLYFMQVHLSLWVISNVWQLANVDYTLHM